MAKFFDELKSVVFWRDVVSEAMVTCLLLVAVTVSQVTVNADLYKPNILHVGLMVGFVVFLLIEIFGHIGGGHMNPIATFAFACNRRISVLRAIFYTIAQCGGGIIGSAIVYALVPSAQKAQFHAFTPAPGVSTLQGIGVETLITFQLIMTALSATDSKERPVYMASLPIGMAIGMGILEGGIYTGGTMNPVVALGPAVISKDLSYHWIYWVGPYLGGALAVGTYSLFIYIKARWGNNNNNAEKQQKRDDIVKLLDAFVEEKLMEKSLLLEKLSTI